MNRLKRLGVISDTHGLLRPEAIQALKNSDLIIHAGDIGKPAVIHTLQEIAPVVAVRGNVDKEAWADELPLTQAVEAGKGWIYIIHDMSGLDFDPVAAGFCAVIFGHSHQPSLETRKGVIFLNPGSAGPRRFQLPVSLAVIDVESTVLKPQLVQLNIEK